MYKNVYEYISPLLLLSVKPQNVTRFFFSRIPHSFLFFTVVDNIYILY